MKPSVRNRALHPRHAVTGDIRRDFVIAVELVKGDVVALIFELAGDATAAPVDWKNVIVRTVGYKYARLAVSIAVNDKTRREGNDALEEVAIDQSERERVSGAIGKAAY
jgi:hypothetical protein